MKGIDFHKRVKSSGLGWKIVADKLGLSKQGLYNLYRKEIVDDEYMRKASELTELDLSQDDAREIFTAKDAIEYTERIVQRLTDQHNVVIEELQKVMRVYEGIIKTQENTLKKHGILS